MMVKCTDLKVSLTNVTFSVQFENVFYHTLAYIVILGLSNILFNRPL